MKAIILGTVLNPLQRSRLAFAFTLIFAGAIAGASNFEVNGQEVEATIQAQALSLRPTDLQMLPSLTEAQVTALVSALDATPTISADTLPRSGTYWSLANPTWPPLPGNFYGLPVWMMDGGNSYLLNDLNVDYAAEANATMGTRGMSLGLPSVDDLGGGTNLFSPNGFLSAVDYGTNLWIAQVSITNGLLAGIGTNTLADIQYEIQSRTNLAQSDWISEGFILGSETNNWTPLSVPQGGRTNLFIRLRSWADNSGNGLPDWWQLQYFGYTGVDPYGSPAGDGWTTLQKYINGWNPTNYYTPPIMEGIYSGVIGSDKNVVSWNAPAVMPNTFTIQRNTGTGWQTLATVAGNLNSYTDINPPAGSTYRVKANYANGSSAYVSAGSPSNLNPSLSLPATVTSGAGGRLFLLTATPANTVTGLVVTAAPYPSDHPKDGIYQVAAQFPYTNFYGINNNVRGLLNASSLQGVPLRLSTGFAPIYGFYQFTIQTLSSNGITGGAVQPVWWADATPFLDGRQHMVDNLNFTLRAAPASQPFDFLFADNIDESAGTFYGIFPNYTTAGFSWAFGDGGLLYRQDVLDPFLPFENDSVLRAFCFSTNRFDDHGNPLDVGFDASYQQLPTMATWDYYFSSLAWAQAGNTNVPARQLDGGTAQYIFFGPAGDGNDVPDLGMTWDDAIPGWRIDVNARNAYGLRILSLRCVKATPTPQAVTFYTVPAGGIIPAMGTTDEPGNGWLYVQAESPVFKKSGFHFTSLANNSPALTGPGWYVWTGVPNTNRLFASVGIQSFFYLWTQLTVSNAYAGTFSYLQDYFDKAYKIDTGGLVMTNQTGVLSEYGTFFPTEPGPVALVTKPDLATSQTCTGIVQVISLNVDANHDGVIDPTFFGSDFTSPGKPYAFWVNNNFDRWFYDADDNVNYMDDVPRNSYAAIGGNGTPIPDWNYTSYQFNPLGGRAIPTTRDLEDFARLWVCGIDTNMLAVLPANTTITLSWGDTGSPNSGNPTIDLFQAADADGGTGYLTNNVAASNQVHLANGAYNGTYLGRLGPGQSLPLNPSAGWRGNHFIWCGVSNGAGGLTLSIANGSGNTLVQSTVYLRIADIKQMYERWTVGDRPAFPPYNVATQAGEDLPQPFHYTNQPPAGTPYILFVHGWNMALEEKDRYAETAFKRLYWQGYQGRFGSFRWPTDNGFKGTFSDAMLQPHNFDDSEFQAWQSAAGLLNKLTDLNGKYPGQVYLLAHSMGNVVAGEALRLAGTNQVVNTYVASQAAIPAHVYDASVSNPFLLSFVYNNPLVPDAFEPIDFNYGPSTPNIYGNWLATNSAAVGRRVNFYNGNDFALAAPRWCYDQIRKPDTYLSGWYAYDGSTNAAAPWNHFYFQPISGTATNYDIVNNLHSRYEVMAYAAESRSTALGATPTPTLAQSINLARTLNPIWTTDPSGHGYADHFWHSAEFRGDYWSQQGYWAELLSAEGFNLK